MVEDMDMKPGLLDKALVLTLIGLMLAVAMTFMYYLGAYRTVDKVEASFEDFGEVTVEFNGFVYPECFDALFGGKQ